MITATNYIKLTDATVEPVSLAELKEHLHIDSSDEDTYITALGKAARLSLEKQLRVTVIATTWTAKLDEFFGSHSIQLLKRPIRSVTDIKYEDADSTEQTLSSSVYEFSTSDFLPVISLADGQSWPATANERDAVTITFVTGLYADESEVEENWKQAIMLYVGHLHERREQTVAGEVVRVIPWGILNLISTDERLIV